MCGIAGILRGPSSEESRARVAAMLDAMAHRGPDARGELDFQGGAAGMVRLSLIDPTPRGDQPFWATDRSTAILFNGECYNFRQQREKLRARGHCFVSDSDTEVVLALYLEHGEDFVDHLRGMYALAIFDWRRGGSSIPPRVLLARDPLGIKPLYIAEPRDRAGLLFSSEIRALVASGLVPAEVNRAGLADYLTFGFLPQPRTMLQDVRMMQAGTIEVIENHQPSQSRRFWRISAAEPRRETKTQAAERLRAVLEESVTLHSFADVPVGAFLSGGVDSTGITALMRPHIDQLHTFTLSFPDVPDADECAAAAATAQRLGCSHTVVEVPDGSLPDILRRFSTDLDQPSVDGLNTWLISRGAAQQVKAVLSGLGGDEWFAGYPVAQRMRRLGSTAKGAWIRRLGSLAHLLHSGLPEGTFPRLGNFASRRSLLATWFQPHTVFPRHQARRLAGFREERSEDELWTLMAENIRPDWREETPLGLALLLDARIYMSDQLLRDADVTSMAHSLELRIPLVDIEVAAFARSVADDYRLSAKGSYDAVYGRSGSKAVLREALADVLPAELASRSKRGFSLPYHHWMSTCLAPLVEETCSPRVAAESSLVEPQQVAVLRNKDHRPEVRYPQLWSLMILELWYRSLQETASKSVPPSN